MHAAYALRDLQGRHWGWSLQLKRALLRRGSYHSWDTTTPHLKVEGFLWVNIRQRSVACWGLIAAVAKVHQRRRGAGLRDDFNAGLVRLAVGVWVDLQLAARGRSVVCPSYFSISNGRGWGCLIGTDEDSWHSILSLFVIPVEARVPHQITRITVSAFLSVWRRCIIPYRQMVPWPFSCDPISHIKSSDLFTQRNGSLYDAILINLWNWSIISDWSVEILAFILI